MPETMIWHQTRYKISVICSVYNTLEIESTINFNVCIDSIERLIQYGNPPVLKQTKCFSCMLKRPISFHIYFLKGTEMSEIFLNSTKTND